MPEKNNYYTTNPVKINNEEVVFDVLDIIRMCDFGFEQGNVFKYIFRYNKKHKNKLAMKEDLEKAITYIERMIENL